MTKLQESLSWERHHDWSLGNHGLNITEPFDTFWNGFPEEILTKIEEFSGRKVIRETSKPYSGTAVIDDFGPRQMETGELIIYTSADPVLQIAAHEDIIPLDELYRICEYARSITLNVQLFWSNHCPPLCWGTRHFHTYSQPS